MPAESVSLFFFAGDFAEVLRRHESGEPQVYATHPEVAKLVNSLADSGIFVTIYRYWSDDKRVEEPRNNVRIVALNAQKVGDTGLLTNALCKDNSDVLIPHFPDLRFVTQCMDTGKPVMLAMANSYNKRGPRGYLEERRLVSVLNDPRLQVVANHCWPSTQKLAQYGVEQKKLLAWDVPKSTSPWQFRVKSRVDNEVPVIAYTGSINESKGVGDLLRAVAILKERGIAVKVKIAGLGDLDIMTRMATKLKINDCVSLLGRIPNPEVMTLFRESDLVAIPSRRSFPEGFPLALFEAIASRTPIVCSDHPMFTPVLAIADRAAVFTQRNPRSFANAIERILSNAELYKKLSQNAGDSWADLQRSADWQTLLKEFIVNGASSEWIQQRTYERMMFPKTS